MSLFHMKLFCFPDSRLQRDLKNIQRYPCNIVVISFPSPYNVSKNETYIVLEAKYLCEGSS